ncbi:hypothetical protein [Novosphingobium sp. ERN07]|uniref:DUF6946 family protein n=1 Tax=Novosphingobium sp. ERN07 TaxID=2726187 RepID=UPI00197D70CF|nr:hypothetical protein [Novosphingobium sp. ERN07]
MANILIPSSGPDDWQRFLAKPDLQWRIGYSARTLAYCWEAASSLPTEVAAIMDQAFGPPTLLLAIPEHKTVLPGGTRESQSDIFTLVRHDRGLATYTIEGKVGEAFGETVADWSRSSSPGKIERLAYLCKMLGLTGCPPVIRYQLLHRTVSALIEADRFDASVAGMIVHSFSPDRRWFLDFAAFIRLLGGGDIEPGQARVVTTPSGRPLVLGWACGDQTYLQA